MDEFKQIVSSEKDVIVIKIFDDLIDIVDLLLMSVCEDIIGE